MAERVKQKICFEEDAHYLYNKIRARLDTKVDKEEGKGLSSFDFSQDYKNKLDNLDDNLDSYVKKEDGKGLSTRDYTDLDWWRLQRLQLRLQEIVTPIYTIGLKKNESDPDKIVEYFDDARFMRPITADAQKKTIDMGDWEDSFIWNKIKTVLLKFNGEEDVVLNPKRFDRLENGTSTQSSGTLNYDGNMMTRLETLYIKLSEDTDYQYISLTGLPITGYVPVGFQRADASILDRIYIGSQISYEHEGKLRSIMGQTISHGNYSSMTEKVKSGYETEGYSALDYGKRQLIAILFTLLFKTTDVKTALPKAEGDNEWHMEHGIGWDQKGNTYFLGLQDFIKYQYTNQEHLIGLEAKRDGTASYKLIPPYDQTQGYTDTFLTIQNGPVTKLNFEASIGLIELQSLQGHEGEYFVDTMSALNEAYNNNRVQAMTNDGLWGYDLTKDKTSGTAGIRLVYEPKENLARAVDDE